MYAPRGPVCDVYDISTVKEKGTIEWDYCTEENVVVADNNPLNEDTSEHYSTTAFSVCDKDGNIVYKLQRFYVEKG